MPDSGDAGANVELGLKFTTDTSGFVSGVRFYKSASNTGVHSGSLWSADGSRLANATFSDESASGWQQVSFSPPVAVSSGTTYVVSYHTNAGHYTSTKDHVLGSADCEWPAELRQPTPSHADNASERRQRRVPVRPERVSDSTAGATNYWVDPVFVTSVGAASVPTAPSGVSASAGNASATVGWIAPSNGGSPITSYTVTPFIGAVAQAPTTVTGAPPAISTVVNSLTNGVEYTFTVTATNDVGTGVASAASNTVTPSAGAPSCPCTLFGPTVPTIVDGGDPGANVELGVKFTADTAGSVTGVRFYKSAANTGVHLGSLWSSTGMLLASATFAGESASGWQQVTFSQPVAVTAGATYVASYHTTTGHYSATGQGFAIPLDNAPLHAPRARPSVATGSTHTGRLRSRTRVSTPRTTGLTWCSTPRARRRPPQVCRRVFRLRRGMRRRR